MSENRLTRKNILKKSNDIGYLFKKGKYFKGRFLWVIILKNNQKSERKVAFLVKKKLGRKAVLRNKIKRWMREIYRSNQSCLPNGVSIILLPVKSYDVLNFKKLYEDFFQIINDKKFVTYIS